MTTTNTNATTLPTHTRSYEHTAADMGLIALGLSIIYTNSSRIEFRIGEGLKSVKLIFSNDGSYRFEQEVYLTSCAKGMLAIEAEVKISKEIHLAIHTKFLEILAAL